MSQDREWTDPVSLGSVNRDYDQGFADGCSESKRLNEHLVAAFSEGRAAGLEEAAKRIWIECIAAADDNDLRIYTLLAELRKSILNLSPTSSDAGKDDPIIATWPAEIWLQAGDEPLGHYSEYEDVTWCRIPQGESDVRYVRASSLEVIGKGEKG